MCYHLINCSPHFEHVSNFQKFLPSVLTFLYCIFLKGLLAIRLIADAVICFLVCKKINLLSKSFSRKVCLTFLAVGVDLKNKSSGASCQLITVFWPPDILVIVAIFPEKKIIIDNKFPLRIQNNTHFLPWVWPGWRCSLCPGACQPAIYASWMFGWLKWRRGRKRRMLTEALKWAKSPCLEQPAGWSPQASPRKPSSYRASAVCLKRL